MKTKTIIISIVILMLAWIVMFQAAQPVSSSPMMRLTLTASKVATLPPPPVDTRVPLIPVTGVDKSSGNADILIVGGIALLVLGVAGLAWPSKKKVS